MPHYALSELFIVLTVLLALFRFRSFENRLAMVLGAVGLALLGITAALGAARFGLGLHDQLKTVHLLFNDLFSTVGLTLLVLMVLIPLLKSRQDLLPRLGTLAALGFVLGSIVGLDAMVKDEMAEAPRWHIFHVAMAFWILGLLRMMEGLETGEMRKDESPTVN